ncbi:carbohydrate ABC transporter substrate-binding protein (CUT1 family) [Streptomyces sp. TLI_235]|nr:ABC transporter substrate-binding protein [Streptomyces sp. TLI_235]PBC71862.1 carbohydrate ABC transporter substrate-binding protein (CUT1 family) [Streptomyces sp. TLI_235]
MRTTRTRLTAMAATAVLAVTGSACAAPHSTSPGSEPSGTITWYSSTFGRNDVDLRKTLVKAFEKVHPAIHVTVKDVPSDTDRNRAAITGSILRGSDEIDVYNGDVVWPAQFGREGLALPLSEHLDGAYWQSFDRTLLDGLQYDGKIMAAPLFTDNGFLFYRKDLLDKARLPAPTTWEQLRQEAKQLQDAGLVKYGFSAQWAGYEGLTCGWTEFSADSGGRSVDYHGGTAQIDSPENLKALTYMKGLIDDAIAPKAITTFKEDESQALFNSGQSAFLRNWAYGYNDARENPASKISGKVGVVNLPAFEGQIGRGRTTVGGWGLYVNPHSRNIDADLAFVRWMTGLEAQKILAVKGGLLPARSGVLDDLDVQNANPVFQVAFMNRMVTRPTWTADYANVSKAIYTDLNAALTGTGTPANALKKAQSDITAALAATP